MQNSCSKSEGQILQSENIWYHITMSDIWQEQIYFDTIWRFQCISILHYFVLSLNIKCPILISDNIIWHYLTLSVTIWHNQMQYEAIWHYLIVSDTIWQYQTLSDKCWHYLTVSDTILLSDTILHYLALFTLSHTL